MNQQKKRKVQRSIHCQKFNFMAMVRLFITIFLCLILLTHAGESTNNADEGHSETIVADTPVQHVDNEDHPQHGSLGEKRDLSLDKCPNYNEDSEDKRALGPCANKNMEIIEKQNPKILTSVEADNAYSELVKIGKIEEMWLAFRESPEFQTQYGILITDEWLNVEKTRFHNNFKIFLKNVAIFTNEQTVIHSTGSQAHQCSMDAFKITGTLGGACGGIFGGIVGGIIAFGTGQAEAMQVLAYAGFAVVGSATGSIGYILTYPFAYGHYYFARSGVGIDNVEENNMERFKEHFVEDYIKDNYLADQCSICQESFHAEGYKNAKGFVMLPCCQKLAHKGCIQDYIQRNRAQYIPDRRCFQCRQTVQWTVKVTKEGGNPFKN